jgi:hypothetical protein
LALIALALFILLPLVQAIILSFTVTVAQDGAAIGTMGLMNYAAVLGAPELRAAMVNSATYVLLNVALYALVRCKVLADGALHQAFAGQLMMGFGLLSVVVAALFLSRQKDVKRMFAYSSIEHMGLITFAFGMGGPVANFAGLLPLWDVIFGTYYLPRDRSPSSFGTDTPVPPGLLGQLVFPFRRQG